MIYLISYDIADDGRRADVAALLSAHGPRVQLSVFECDLATKAEVEQLVAELEQLIEPVEDQVRLYPLAAPALRDRRILGSRTLEERRDFWIL